MRVTKYDKKLKNQPLSVARYPSEPKFFKKNYYHNNFDVVKSDKLSGDSPQRVRRLRSQFPISHAIIRDLDFYKGLLNNSEKLLRVK